MQKKTKIALISLGCDKNLVDSQRMMASLQEAGYQPIAEEKEAEVIVIQTCCFIHDAKEESIETILKMAQYKQTGKLKILVVTGCLAQRYAKEMQKEIPEIDVLLGTAEQEQLIAAIQDAQMGKKKVTIQSQPERKANTPLQKRAYEESISASTTAYLKIAEGCNKCCTYCIIPKIRGRYQSVPMEQLYEEATELAKRGCQELILIAQETTVYGLDLYGEKKLPELLRMLCKIPQLKWIRLLYSYPEEITNELIQTIQEEKKICNYLDLPMQHASDAILKKMGRKTNQAQLREQIQTLRKQIPGIALRTTCITGFPGETKQDHAILKSFLQEMRFDRLGVFAYSLEEGTKAATFQRQISKRKKEERRAELMQLQQRISYENGKQKIGQILTVLVEGSLPEETENCQEGETVYVARTYMDAPQIDGYLFFTSKKQYVSGTFVTVRVIEAKEYDLIGEEYDEFTE